jgi:hypothetical protein
MLLIVGAIDAWKMPVCIADYFVDKVIYGVYKGLASG